MNLRKNIFKISILFILLYAGETSLYACGLAFLPGATIATANINGTIDLATEWEDAAMVSSLTEPCLNNLKDGASIGSLVDREVKIYTKRDGANFYIAVDVDDSTLPTAISPNEKIIIYMDINNSRESTLQAGDNRLEITIPRNNTNLASNIVWTNVISNAFQAVALPAGVTAMSLNRPSGLPGYQVEIKIPFSVFSPAYNLNQGDFGMAIAVINDLGFQQSAGGFMVWQLTAVGLPADNTHLPIHIDDDPIEYADNTSEWNRPENWGEAFTSGAGDLIYFSDQPQFWLSKDIVSAFCNASNFDQVIAAGGRNAANPFWYKYRSANPCKPVRVWAKLRRKGALIGVEKRRVLFLWGEPGVGVRNWSYLGLSEPVTIDPGSSPVASDETFPARYEFTRTIDWDNISSGLSGHPCLKAIALPMTLQQQDVTAFLSYEMSPGVQHSVDLLDILGRYNITGQNNQAQMNILVVNSAVCPAAASCIAPSDASINLNKYIVASTDLSGLELAQLSDGGNPVTGNGSVAGSADILAGEVKDKRSAVFNLTGYGVAAEKEKNYAYVETIGGLQQVVSIDYMKKNRRVQVPVNFTNRDDGLDREMYLNVKALSDFEETGISIDIASINGKMFKSGETHVVKTNLIQGKPDNPPACGCFDFACLLKK